MDPEFVTGKTESNTGSPEFTSTGGNVEYTCRHPKTPCIPLHSAKYGHDQYVFPIHIIGLMVTNIYTRKSA